uniref:Uncharacterized protein n=1 Tax=Panagrolaimus sp. JU765 TaxID=591449 RepID=A0AC34RHE7_9BILA
MQHIKTLPEVFPMIYKILKPGGKVLITLYGKGHGELKPKFLDYVAHRHYYLFNTEEIQSFAEKAGFVQIRTENLTQRFKEILLEEREHTVKNKEDFISRFSKELYDYMLEGWEDKLGYIADDNHNWNLIYAEKPI